MKKFYFALVLTLFVLPFFAQNIPSYVPKDGLVGWWPFNGNANDESGNGNNGTVNGATLSADRNGVANSAYSFDGQTNYIGVPFTSNLAVKNISISLWINIPQQYNGNNEFGFIIRSRFFGYEILYLNSDKSLSFILHHNYSNKTSQAKSIKQSYNDQTWRHLVCTFDGKINKLYIDGTLLASDTSDISDIYYQTDGIIAFGKDGGNPSPYTAHFNGILDDIGIWNQALTQEEISALYTEKTQESSVPSYIPKGCLEGFWPFNGNANDESGKGNDGIVKGATLTTDRNGDANSAYTFNGISDKIEVQTGGILGNAKRSMFGWIKSSSVLDAVFRDMIPFSLGYSGGNTPNGSFGLGVKENEVSIYGYTDPYDETQLNINKNILDDQWHFIGVTYDGIQTLTFYVDGVQIFQKVRDTDKSYATIAGLFFGGWNDNNRFFNGQIDDITLFSCVLSQKEINALYTKTPICNGPIASIYATDSTTFCQGGSAILTAAVTSASTPIYQWYNNDQAITNATQNTYKVTTAGKYTVKVVDGACEAVSLPKEVTVNPKPTATISPSGNVSKICEGSTLTLVADGGVSYKWNTGATENKITVSKKGPYYADVINQFGCKSVVWRDVVVEALPIVTINNLKQIAFKNDSAIQLEGTPKGGVFTGEGVNGNTFNPEKAALGKKAITYTYSSTNGCKGEAKGTILLVDSLGNVCSSTKYDTVKVNTYDTITVTNNVTKYDTVIVPKTVTKYDTITVKNNIYDTVIVPKTITKYDTVKVNTYDTITVTNNVTKYDTVIVPKTVTKYDTIKVNKYDTITFTKNVTKYDTVIVNKTKYDTVIVPKTITKYDTVKVNTYDTITVTNNVTKYDTVLVNKYDTITVTDTVSILKINFKLTTGIKANQMTSMSIYPNPTSDVLIIDASDLAAITGYSYRILDVLGKEVYNALVTAAKTEISLKTLGAKGMYVLHILDANKLSVQTKQIVLE